MIASEVLNYLFLFFNSIPFILPFIWIFGAVHFYISKERKSHLTDLTKFKSIPVTILLPCFNEEKTVTSTIKSFDHLDHFKFEVLAINDGSSDKTQAVLEDLAIERNYLRVVNLLENRGKAAALSIGANAANYDFLLCIDADAQLDKDTIAWLLSNFEDKSVGAVTGNPRVKNRNTLIGRLQVGEFSALIGLIKRYHQSIGQLFALSGVLTLFKKEALLDVGLWDTDTVTEDIAITWKLQLSGWEVRYEPHAICDVLMPDYIKGLWSQRLRWAQGGVEVVLKYFKKVLRQGSVGMRLILLEYTLTVIWACLSPLFLISFFMGLISPQLVGFLLFFSGLCTLVQFAVGYFLQRRYEESWKIGALILWYPYIYWLINSLVLLAAVPKVLFGKKHNFSSWISPDRGGIIND